MSANASFGPHERLTQARIDGRYDEELACILDEANDQRIDWVQAQLEEQRVPMMSSADVSWRTRHVRVGSAASERIIDHIIDVDSHVGPLMARMACYRIYVHDWPFIDLFMSMPSATYALAIDEDGR